jgi:Protein of unknown function (DUF1064)
MEKQKLIYGLIMIKLPKSFLPKQPKYKNTKVTSGSITFDSKLEERRYYQLRNDPNVVNIEVHPVFDIFPATKKKIDGKMVTFQKITYAPDFKVTYKNGKIECEDVKGTITEVFNIKRKLFEAAYPDLTIKIIRLEDIKRDHEKHMLRIRDA